MKKSSLPSVSPIRQDRRSRRRTTETPRGNQGVGIYVAGHDFGKGDTVEIEGTPHEVVGMRRMQLEGEAVTLIVEAKSPLPTP